MKPDKYPLVSVLLPVYNGERYIAVAIESILRQTYPAFELLIINDGSKDATARIISKYTDKRIKVYAHKEKKGIVAALNYGIKKSQGELIARIDADDIAFKMRLVVQVNYLQKNSEVGVVGSWVELVDEMGKRIGEKKYPVAAYKYLPFYNPICHPSVMYRRNIIKLVGGYNPDLSGAEDYDLWFRAAKITKIVNIAQPLIQYRIHMSSVSFSNTDQLHKAFIKTKIRAITHYGYPIWYGLFLIKTICVVLLPKFAKRILYKYALHY